MSRQDLQPGKEEDVYNLQIGLGASVLSYEEKHHFDIAGYCVLQNQLTKEHINDLCETVARIATLPSSQVGGFRRGSIQELVHVIESGGTIEDAMALPDVINHVMEFIWGRQYRLIGSRAFLAEPGTASPLTQGGAAADRRFAAYRCMKDGQFRCLMVTCLVPLENVSFMVIPSSHKASFPHPYQDCELNSIGPLVEVSVPPGSAVLYTESLSHAFRTSAAAKGSWIVYHYGTSYMVNWPGCDPSQELLTRTADDPEKSHLLLKPYYHPSGSYRKKADE